MGRILLALWIGGALVAGGFESYAQDNATTSEAEKKSEEAAEAPGLSDFLPRIGELRVRSDELEQKLAEHVQIDSFRERYEENRTELDAVQEKLEQLRAANTYGFDDVTSLRGRVWQVNENLLALTNEVAERFAELESLQEFWSREADDWEAFDQKLVKDQDDQGTRNLFIEAHSLTNKALEAISESYAPISEFQARVARLQNQSQSLLVELDALMKTLREGIFRVNAPFMFSPAYWGELKTHLWLSSLENFRKLDLFNLVFLKSYGWLLALQMLLAAGLAMTIRSKRKDIEGEESWRFMLKHPWATSILLVMVLSIPVYRHFPTAWRFLFWILASVCVVRIIGFIVREKWQQYIVLVVTVPFLVSMLFKIIELPLPLFRLYIAVVALVGCPFGFRLASRIDRVHKRDVLYVQGLRLGSALLLVVFLSQVAGLSSFSIHVFESTVKSMYLLLFWNMILLFARGALELLLRSPWLRKLSIVQRHRDIIFRQLFFLFKLFAVVSVTTMVLTTWGFFDSPAQAWQSVTGFGFSIGDTRWSVRLIFLAVLVVFGTLLLSRILQSVLWEEVYRRKNIEEGIGISINRLIHYFLLAAGFFLLLSTLGFRLQNLAILGGAVGIGIGFGLQNIVSNFVSGLILLIERPVKVGDVVVMDGVWGSIQALGLRATIVETFDASEIIIPNSDLITGKVVNWTRVNRNSRLVVPVGVAYGSNIERVIEVLTQVASGHPRVASHPAPVVHFTAFADSSLNFDLKVWVSLNDRLSVQTDLMKEIDKRFREESIEIPFPQRDVHMRNGEGAS